MRYLLLVVAMGCAPALAQGLEPATSTPDELARLVRDGVPTFAKIVKAAGIKPE